MRNIFCNCLLLLLGFLCRGQHAVVISGHPIVYNQHEGWLEYKSGESLQGLFQYADMEFPSFNLKLFDSTGSHIIRRIPTKNIQKITLAGHDPKLNDRDSTYFVNIKNKSRLFRQLSFGDTKIFDDLFSVGENPARLGDEFVVMQDSTTIFASNQKDLLRALSKLPRPVIVQDDESVWGVIHMLNKISK